MYKIYGDNSSQYRVKPTLFNGLITVAIYAAFLITLQKLSGVAYTDIADTSNNLLKGVLLPVAAGSLVLTGIGFFTGWFKDVWQDKYKIKNHAWLYVFVVLTVMGIVGNLIGGNIGGLEPIFIAYALIATLFVGYSEELLCRGYMVVASRGSGFSERQVMLITMMVFGSVHSLNILNGQAVGTTLVQVFLAGLQGGAFYVMFRKTGTIVVPMTLHALWDFSILTQNLATGETIKLLGVGLVTVSTYGSIILLPFAARLMNVNKKSSPQGVLAGAQY